MADICSCSTGIINNGQPNCVDSFARDARLVFVEYLDDSGAVNSIKSTDTLDSTYINDRLNAGATGSSLSLSQRWYVTPTINNVVGERAENVVQEIDGIAFNVRQGNRMYDGTFYGNVAAAPYIKALKSMQCQKMGFFIIDVAGNIIGLNNELTGDLDPIKIQQNTLQCLYNFPNSSEVQAINLKFMWEENQQDGDLSFIGSSSIGVNLLTVSSVATVVLGEATAISTTGFTTTLSFLYGKQFNRLPKTGGLPAEFSIYNVTADAAVTPLTAPESPDGTYAITFAAQTAADVLRVSYFVNGFESTTDLTVTIP